MAGIDTVVMAKRVLDHHGLDYEIKRGKHVKFVVTHGQKKQTLVTGGTVSDKRAVLNFFHTIKRILTDLGVDFLPDSRNLVYN